MLCMSASLDYGPQVRDQRIVSEVELCRVLQWWLGRPKIMRLNKIPKMFLRRLAWNACMQATREEKVVHIRAGCPLETVNFCLLRFWLNSSFCRSDTRPKAFFVGNVLSSALIIHAALQGTAFWDFFVQHTPEDMCTAVKGFQHLQCMAWRCR